MQVLTLKKYLFFSMLFFTIVSSSQNTLTLKKGIVKDSLVIPSTGNRFSIYLPKSFDLNKKWPILLGFDSTGETGKTATLYKKVAEEHGYIVAISNFLEDQKEGKKIKYVSDFMNHVFSLFPIQDRRVYLIGQESDARLASLIPLIYTDEVFGVIAINDSYYYTPEIKNKKNFSYLGIVSADNYKYSSFLNNKKYLKNKAIPADVFVYQKTIADQRSELIGKSLSTFTLQAMAKGRVAKDTLWVKKLFQKDMIQVTSYIDTGLFLEAYNEIERIRSKYGMFMQTTHLKEKQKEIKKEKEYKRQKRLQTKYFKKERFLKELYAYSLDIDVKEKKFENLGWWKYQILELDSLQQKKEKYAHNMAYRTKGYMKYLVDTYKKVVSTTNNNLEERLLLNILSTIIDKKDFMSYLEVISLSAADQDKETALFYLEQLLENGYNDFNRLYSIEGTLSIRMSEEYNRMIKKYLGKSKYFFSN